MKKTLAWLVHMFTASGLVAGFMAILAINEQDWRMAMFWLIVAGFIDGIDGTFARMVKVNQVLPHVNGKNIDTVVDFVNYAAIPAYLLFQYEAFPKELGIPTVALILMVSAVYYGIEGMVSEDMHFIGFPVLWNVLSFYIIFVFSAGVYFNTAIVVIFAVLHFIPLKFAYPSRKSRFQRLDLGISIILFFAMLFAVFMYPEKRSILSVISYLCGFYFLGMAVYNTYLR